MVVHDVEIGIALILFQFCIIPTYDTNVWYHCITLPNKQQ
jgi:hypothetical protein